MDLTVFQDRHAIADTHGRAHVVLDQQDRQAEFGPKSPDEVGQDMIVVGSRGLGTIGRLSR